MPRSRASKDLPVAAKQLAERFVEFVLSSIPPDGAVSGKRSLRVVGRSRRGGLRVDGGEDGFRPRTVSLTDIGWVLAADDRDPDRTPTEADVNAVRYDPETPRRSTRWVDTRIALEVLLWAKQSAGWSDR